MSALREPDWLTVEDFWALVGDGEKADLLDGVIHLAPPESPWINLAANWLQFLVAGYVCDRRLGIVFTGRVAFVLNEFCAPEPDIAFVAAARMDAVAADRVCGAPDVAIEIVSRDSRARDYEDKYRLYEEAGVREYWLIDPIENRAHFLRLAESGFRPVELREGRLFESEALPGFWLDTGWLTSEERPDEYECLQRILAGGPEEMKREATDA
ncbi:MAG: Uma2 family endonuclease [Armatimonadota bacterium]